ncbi:tRNA (guanine-N(7)-)-methyltransferase [Caldalkalibacillus thermarum TA2.A1]|uniref:tRNA (guanine-N(7)-)-methyltransferase n=1 Tax=Caldalkalibacillus thermarum (strain TA2.A1) TaxID=986075 RepID=F5L563_CALTT|nr:tRNA (guanosine(46)-N7)-methyltransferase TrmB [Caldalkalibacillus thermarum]EGL83530.1 tRNA (guanine-N(7)-)-methyltransferase [Caldalkalibacillus thermarum TA2.A1]QZT32530.1 tRNA (guanosine(46)-N7)-methyltransferase TrmB [Caldalkalibacillus thermarum TA2.A1]
MRMRRKPWAEEEIKNNPHLVVPRPHEWRGKWHQFFNNTNPIHIEIGTGKGQFIIEMAKTHPHINFIGLELNSSVLGVALRKLIAARQETELDNCCLIRENATQLTDLFAPGEVERIYLNFSDPWPKRRHAKRRLTYHTFLDLYSEILAENGEIHLKTDNEKFFEFSLNSLSDYGFRLKNITFDLHNSDFEGNIMTEYEEKFAAQGMKIYRCEAVMGEGKR